MAARARVSLTAIDVVSPSQVRTAHNAGLRIGRAAAPALILAVGGARRSQPSWQVNPGRIDE